MQPFPRDHDEAVDAFPLCCLSVPGMPRQRDFADGERRYFVRQRSFQFRDLVDRLLVIGLELSGTTYVENTTGYMYSAGSKLTNRRTIN